MFYQNYNPTGSVVLSTLLAAVPILALLYFIALHPWRDATGKRHLGIAAPYAAFAGVVAAFVISCVAFHMPFVSAFSAFALGTLSGFLGIIWIVVGAMFLYTITVITGKFEIVKESITHISFDRRIQVILIAFSFGAVIEGTSGFGTPVAIAGAVMVGLGFSPFQAAVLNLLANTAPVAWGAIGTPIVTLASVSGLDQLTLSAMAGRQLPFVSVLVPFWLVVTFVRMEGGTWKEAFGTWPCALCAGASFALMQHFASGTNALHLITDVVSGVFSLICTTLFLRFVWQPKDRFLLASERASGGVSTTDAYKYTAGQTAYAWLPWAILILCCALWGAPEFKKFLNGLFSGVVINGHLFGSKFGGPLSLPVWEMPHLHNLVQRMPPAVPAGAKPEAAKFTINWLSAAGTGVVLAAILTGSGAAPVASAVEAGDRAHRQPHEDAGAGDRPGARPRLPHALCRHRRRARPRVHQRGRALSVLLVVPRLAGRLPDRIRHGVERAVRQPAADHRQSAAPERDPDRRHQLHRRRDGQDDRRAVDHGRGRRLLRRFPQERAHAVGPIFRKVFWHSVAGAAVIGIIALLQAYVFPGMIPIPPPKH